MKVVVVLDSNNPEQLIAAMTKEIENSFLIIYKKDENSAAELSLYLLGYIFCKVSKESRSALIEIIKLISQVNHLVFEDFSDLKDWIDEKRIEFLLDGQEHDEFE